MAVKIRLARHGATKAPFYRVVVTDGRSPRDGRFIEVVGRYNPRTEPSFVELDVEKVEAWIGKGAQPSETVLKLLAIAKGEKEAPAEAEKRPSKKALAKEEAAAAEAEAATEAASEEAADAQPGSDEPAEAEAAAETEESAEDDAAPEADEPAAEESSE